MNTLKLMRVNHEWTQGELASHAGVSYQTISNLERRQVLASEDLVRKLSTALGIPPMDLAYLMLPESLTPECLRGLFYDDRIHAGAILETQRLVGV